MGRQSKGKKQVINSAAQRSLDGWGARQDVLAEQVAMEEAEKSTSSLTLRLPSRQVARGDSEEMSIGT